MNAFVAGGAGFIGSHLVDALLEKGDRVICVDNFYLGKKENIIHQMKNPNFVFYEADLHKMDHVDAIFQKENVDYVYHLAANSDIQASANNPSVELDNTFLTTYVLLENMRIHGVKHLFFASTSAVYGDKDGVGACENDILSPISYYGAAKMSSEAMISAYSFMNDYHSLVFRFPNVVGARLTHGVIFDFVKKLRNNPAELEILGDGEQRKPYMLVNDLVDGILHFADVPQGVTQYNIGVDTQTCVKEIADIVTDAMGLSPIYRFTGGKGGWKGDVPVFSYNLEKIHTAGWSAEHTSDEAVRETVKSVL